MRLTVFTGNDRRHLWLVKRLAGLSMIERVYAIIMVPPAHQRPRENISSLDHFRCVDVGQCNLFGDVGFPSEKVRMMALSEGTLQYITPTCLGPASTSDAYIHYDCGRPGGELFEHLDARRCIGISPGISPFYTGCDTNYVALSDGRIDMVGATIHRLGEEPRFDDLLYHAIPRPVALDPYDLEAYAHRTAINSVAKGLLGGSLLNGRFVEQDAWGERIRDRAAFTDEIAAEYLTRVQTPEQVERELQARDMSMYLEPYMA